MTTVFDATDVSYLMQQFTVPQLRHEIKSARAKLRGEIDPFWQLFYTDFIAACQLAISLSTQDTNQPTNKHNRISAEDIKARYDLVDYIGQYVNLRKSGNRYQGLCPFHSDKNSPSFVVYANQSYHCFGCQAHGTIIDFVMRYDNLDFKSALEKLR